MKTHTNDFKNEIKQFGKEIDSKITYTSGGQTIELGKEDLNSITPHYEGSMLKSVMKQLDVDSNVEIPLETVINYQFGLKVGNEYEYLNYGNYVVYKVEKQEDTNSYKLTCYDKMLYAMKDYESLGITYPITIKNYLSALCTKIGLTLKSGNFANQDRTIASELYLDADGNSLGYTYRDVLDEIAQATGSTICINEDSDELEVRYVNDAGTISTIEGTNITIPNSDNEKFDLQLQGDTSQSGTPTPSSPQPVNVVSGRQYFQTMGKNRLPYTEDFTETKNGTILTGNKGTYTIENTPSANFTSTIRYLKDTYTIQSGDYLHLMNNVASANVVFSLYFTDGTSANPTINPVNRIWSLSSYVGKVVDRISFYVQTVFPGTKTTLTPMIVNSSTATTFEEYKGQSYEINLGKNLLDLKDGTYTSTDITAVVENGEITLNGTAGGNRFVSIALNNKINWTNGEKYTISAFNSVANSNLKIRINSGGQLDTTLNAVNKTQTITYSGETDILNNSITIRVQSGTTLTDYKIKPQLEKGSVASQYSAYKTPIELCKIGTYQDFIKKGTGKNLFDKDNITDFVGYVNAQGKIVAGSNTYSIYIPCKPNTTYTMQKTGGTVFSIAYTDAIPVDNGNAYGRILDNTATSLTITTGANAKYLISSICADNYSGKQQIINTIMINEGSTALPYEPYGMYNKWYKEGKVGKVVLKGSEEYIYQNNTFRINVSDLTTIGDSNIKEVSNYYQAIPYSASWGNYDYFISNTNGSPARLVIKNKDITSVSDFKTWLSTHNTTVYYVLATPTYTEITDTELINQLNAPRLLEGLNNVIISSSDLSSPIKITYTSQLDTIDEEYLKDINVNFGEKFGKVNSIVLSRSAESDNIYLRDEESVLANGLCEIKIKDNQIMSDNNRVDFLQELLDKLDGLEYYINDFASPGIMYYNLCDKYKVKIGDNYYKCIMFNDEVNITQGLEENIYTEMPEETETDYTKSDKTDQKINQAYIIVDKQNQQINSVVQNVNTLSTIVNSQGESIDALGTRLTQTTDSITASVSSIQEELDNGVSLVKTTSVLINDLGLNVSTDTSKISTTMTNNSFEIKDSGNTTLAYFGYNENEQTSKAEMDNLTVRTYFIAGVHRTETYEENYEERTGWFYIGG